MAGAGVRRPSAGAGGRLDVDASLALVDAANKEGEIRVPYTYVTENGEKYEVTAVCIRNNIKVETGTITFSNGDRYEGEWSGGAKNGQGKYTCSNGVCYDGKWRHDQRHGSGVCKYANGDVYEGRWCKNHKHGHGTYRFHNGNVYTGDWRSDRASGTGICHYANGDRYEGGWWDDRAHGTGSYKYGSGELFSGDWVKGKKCGKGSFRFLSGDVYIGEFCDDDINGQGQKTYANGDVYTGEWVRGMRHGRGAQDFVSGLHGGRFEGQWALDKPCLPDTNPQTDVPVVQTQEGVRTREAAAEAERRRAEEEEEEARLRRLAENEAPAAEAAASAEEESAARRREEEQDLQQSPSKRGLEGGGGLMGEASPWRPRPGTPVKVSRTSVASLGLQVLDEGRGQVPLGKAEWGMQGVSMERPLSARRPQSARREFGRFSGRLGVLAGEAPGTGSRDSGLAGEHARTSAGALGKVSRTPRGTNTPRGDAEQLSSALKNINCSRLVVLDAPSSASAHKTTPVQPIARESTFAGRGGLADGAGAAAGRGLPLKSQPGDVGCGGRGGGEDGSSSPKKGAVAATFAPIRVPLKTPQGAAGAEAGEGGQSLGNKVEREEREALVLAMELNRRSSLGTALLA